MMTLLNLVTEGGSALTVFFAGLVSLFTWRQVREARLTRAVAEKNTAAVYQSVATFREAERADLVIHARGRGGSGDGSDGLQTYELPVYIENIGRTKGVVKEFAAIARFVALDKKPSLDEAEPIFVPERTVRSSTSVAVKLKYPFKEEWQTRALGLEPRNMQLVLWGRLLYEDIFEEEHPYEFCLRCIDAGSGFVEDASDLLRK